MEELIAVVAGFAVTAATKKGIAVLKRKGVNVPPWLEKVLPAATGAAASFGADTAIPDSPDGGPGRG